MRDLFGRPITSGVSRRSPGGAAGTPIVYQGPVGEKLPDDVADSIIKFSTGAGRVPAFPGDDYSMRDGDAVLGCLMPPELAGSMITVPEGLLMEDSGGIAICRSVHPKGKPGTAGVSMHGRELSIADPSVSRTHGSFSLEDQIADGSSNGTFLYLYHAKAKCLYFRFIKDETFKLHEHLDWLETMPIVAVGFGETLFAVRHQRSLQALHHDDDSHSSGGRGLTSPRRGTSEKEVTLRRCHYDWKEAVKRAESCGFKRRPGSRPRSMIFGGVFGQ